AYSSDTIEEEGIQWDVVRRGNLLVGVRELRRIGLPEVRRGQHAGQQHVHAGLPGLPDYRVKVELQLRWRLRAERVVGPQFHDQVGRLIGQYPVEPGEAA